MGALGGDGHRDWITLLLKRFSGVEREPGTGTQNSSNVTSTGADGSTTRVQRIFGDTYATSYKRGPVRLGAINRFPVMPGSYHFPKWGNGWQSMPVSFLIEGVNCGYLQWETTLDHSVRGHPSYGFLGGYSSPPLFDEQTLPEVFTVSRQQDHAVITIRTMLHLANRAGEISDQWRIPQFKGECWTNHLQVQPGAIVETDNWVLLKYAEAIVAIRALQCLGADAKAPEKARLEIAWEDKGLLIRQYLAKGEIRRIEQDRIESGWVTIVLGSCSTVEEAHARLEGYQIYEDWLNDGEVSRSDRMQIRTVDLKSMSADISLRHDPWLLPRS